MGENVEGIGFEEGDRDYWGYCVLLGKYLQRWENYLGLRFFGGKVRISFFN